MLYGVNNKLLKMMFILMYYMSEINCKLAFLKDIHSRKGHKHVRVDILLFLHFMQQNKMLSMPPTWGKRHDISKLRS